MRSLEGGKMGLGAAYEYHSDMEAIERDRKHRRRVRAIIIMAVILVIKAGIILCVVLL